MRVGLRRRPTIGQQPAEQIGRPLSGLSPIPSSRPASAFFVFPKGSYSCEPAALRRLPPFFLSFSPPHIPRICPPPPSFPPRSVGLAALAPSLSGCLVPKRHLLIGPHSFSPRSKRKDRGGGGEVFLEKDRGHKRSRGSVVARSDIAGASLNIAQERLKGGVREGDSDSLSRAH